MNHCNRQYCRRQLQQEQALAVRVVEILVDFQRLRIIARQFAIIQMLVMAEMCLCCGGLFVLTIGSCRGPGELERQS